MRYALRNQKKIEKELGTALMLVINASLEKHFKENDIIELHDYEGEDFPVIHVQSAQDNTDTTFEFYVLTTHFDVLRLAYKGSMS